MSDFFNKNGLAVGSSSREIFEELMRGTGCVMGKNISLFFENAGLHEKFIVISRETGSGNPVETVKLPSESFQEAFDLFESWKEADQ
ncbi:hypothetical protein UR09_04705 [Candidatus Nitromaritima sp. SCGC AAA799-A02]|nr:hypothetical protein UR09_04705 [Candidatus Nitromaritima sp. SCGC AAA799-A02]